ncbi:MAG TPA: hypothetical protein VFY71_01670 [Planctomycetota bacterium]|nr:hypothetical protein [Planctomycetota bacterium]
MLHALVVVLLGVTAPFTLADTRVDLPRGRAVWLTGEWTSRSELWADASLAFRRKDRDLLVLDGGTHQPRLVYTYPDRAWSRTCGPAWSANGTACYVWLDVHEQLVAMDRDSGHRRSLTNIPTHSWNEKGDQHLDGGPVWRRNGIVDDSAAGLLLFVTREERNDQVAFWQKRSGRGGTSLMALDPEDGSTVALAAKGTLPEVTLSWELSLSRKRLFIVSNPAGKYRPGEPHDLDERRLDGHVEREFDEPAGTAGDLALSPDERWLLVERLYKVGKEIPAVQLDDYTRKDFDVLFEAEHGGFVLIDLDSGEVTDGPASGTEAAWASDNRRIAYVDGWDVNVYDRESQTTTQLIRGGPEERNWSWETWYEPTWSASGRRLALTTGGDGSMLLLDLDTREFMLVDIQATGKLWAPVPKLFGG